MCPQEEDKEKQGWRSVCVWVDKWYVLLSCDNHTDTSQVCIVLRAESVMFGLRWACYSGAVPGLWVLKLQKNLLWPSKLLHHPRIHTAATAPVWFCPDKRPI